MKTLLKARLRAAFELVLDGIVEDVLKQCLNCDASTQHFHHAVPRVLDGKTTIPVCHECHGKIHDANFMDHGELTKQGLRRAADEGRFLMHDESMYQKVFALLRAGYKSRQIRYRLGIGGTFYHKAKKRFTEEQNVSKDPEVPKDNSG